MRARKSIVLVTVDCLRADHVGFMGYERPTTPFLDSLARDSFVIPTAIVAGAPTYYSLPAITASRFPLALGRDVLGLGPDEPTLASVLETAGYATVAFAAGNPYLSARFGYERGFHVFREYLEGRGIPSEQETPQPAVGTGWASRLNQKLQEVRPTMGSLGAVYDALYFEYCQRVTPVPDSLDALRRFPAADVIVDDACSWLAGLSDAPFFLWLHLMDPHSPYCPTDAALALMGEEKLTPFRARYINSYWNRSDLGQQRFQRHRSEVVVLYDAGIRWVDEQVRRLVEFLQRANRWNDCIFVLTADHGEEFLEHGGRYHPPSKLMEELIHVPLLWRLPGIQKREVSKGPFSLIHLAPTLLEAVGLGAPAAFRGHSYLGKLQRGDSFDEVAVSECVAGCTNPFHAENRMGPRVLSVRESRYKLVLHFDPSAEDLYDLEADPREQIAVPAGEHNHIRRRLLEIAREHLRDTVEHSASLTRLQTRLRDLRIKWINAPDKASPVAS
jgi:arylsulfatase A-like enzyme